MSLPRGVAAACALVLSTVVVFTGWRLAYGGGNVVDERELGLLARPAAAAPAPVSRVAPARAPGAASALRADPAWAERIGRAAGIPGVAMLAYGSASLELARTRPGCRLGWTTLAGIGWIESQHGTLGRRALGADGRSTTPIIGPALDGNRFAAIPATPAGSRLHGDPAWDHAFGPLQFITSTWLRWAADGDGDGVRDPFDLDDAALAAGRYLCASGGDLSTAAGWNAAVLSYNHSADYVASVSVAGRAYAARAG